jgi:ribonuclease-3 family protein
MFINDDNIMKDIEALSLPPLVLAYIGDSVFDLYVKTHLVLNGIANNGKLHKVASEYVRASAQSNFVKKVENVLNDDEKDIIRRGRNTYSPTVPKNAELMDYKYATGFEALIGYLYLTGNNNRIFEILGLII